MDDTGIPCCLPAVGRIFKFPMDFELEQLHNLSYEHNSTSYKYLRDVSNSSAFITSVLQMLIEERQTSHRNSWNNNQVNGF